MANVRIGPSHGRMAQVAFEFLFASSDEATVTATPFANSSSALPHSAVQRCAQVEPTFCVLLYDWESGYVGR